MRMMKRGAADWTIGKLMAVVLVIVLLVIVVFGWSRAIVPLYERAEGKVNEVLILLNVREGGDTFVECINRKVLSFDEGETLLNDLGIIGKQREEIYFKFCRSGDCVFNNEGDDFGSYLLKKDKMGIDSLWKLKPDGSGRVKVEVVPIDEVDNVEFYGDLYHAVWELDSSIGKSVGDFFEGRITDMIIFYADGYGGNGEIYAMWGAGYWIIKEHQIKKTVRGMIANEPYIIEKGYDRWGVIYEGTNDFEAMKNFLGVIGDENKESVYYTVTTYLLGEEGGIGSFSEEEYLKKKASGEKYYWNPIGDIVSRGDSRKDDPKMDAPGEVSRFKDWVYIKTDNIEGGQLNEEAYLKFMKSIEGRSVSVGDDDYKIYVNVGNGEVVFEGNSGKYRLKSNPFLLIDNKMNEMIGGKTFPTDLTTNLEFYNKEGVWEVVKYEYKYYMSPDWIDLYIKRSRVKDFLKVKCK